MLGFSAKEKEEKLMTRVSMLFFHSGARQGAALNAVMAYPYWGKLFTLLGRKFNDPTVSLMAWAVSLYWWSGAAEAAAKENAEDSAEGAKRAWSTTVNSVNDLLIRTQETNVANAGMIFGGLEILNHHLGLGKVTGDFTDYMEEVSNSPLAEELRELGVA